MSLKIGSTAINKVYLGSTECKKAYLGSEIVFDNSTIVFDIDAQSYIDAMLPFESITEQKKIVINDLFISLKNEGLYLLLKAFYPIYGSVSDTQKFNAKNPIDTDAAFRLSFTTSITHAFNSFTVTAVAAQYANTHINFLSDTTYNDVSIGIFSKTDSQVSRADFGGGTMQYFSRHGNGSLISDFYNSSGRIITPNNSTLGLVSLSVLPSPVFQTAYIDGVIIGSKNSTSGARQNINLLLGNRGTGTDAGTGRTYGFGYVSSGLTDLQMKNLSDIVNNYIVDINL